MPMISRSDLIEMAAFLASEDGENAEYDRALSELIADAFGEEGVTHEAMSASVLAEIRIKQDQVLHRAPRHTVRGQTSENGWPYGVTHDMDCPACQDTPFTLSPRSETYWAS